MTKFPLFKSLLPGLALCFTLGGTSHAAEKPNIILMISDDHRWDCIGAAGNPNIHTPNIDRIAREGVYFKEGTIHNPQCSPSRAAILSGMADHANGRYSNQRARKDTWNEHGFDQYECLPEALKKEGYATVFVGKWHQKFEPWNVGFDVTGTWMPGGSGPYKGAKLAHGNSREGTVEPGFTQEAFGNSAREMVKKYKDSNTTKPMFMWFALTAPHGPFAPNPDSCVAQYKGKEIKDVLPPQYEGDSNLGTASRWVDYVTAITSADEELGKLLKSLDDAGMSTNTVLVFLGDNGYMMGNRNLNGKVVPWEDSVRVPFIIWGPGVIKAKGETEAVASSLDLPTTFMKLAGGTAPEAWHGRDLTPVLEDGKPHDITWSVSETPDYQNWKFPTVSYRTVRTTTSKLIVWHKSLNKQPEFYDISKDPEEKTNLYNDPAMKDRVAALQKILDDWMKKTNDDWSMRGETLSTEKGGKAGKKATDDDDASE